MLHVNYPLLEVSINVKFLCSSKVRKIMKSIYFFMILKNHKNYTFFMILVIIRDERKIYIYSANF